jgi:RimJ/RimL family protein N-acetyltransferase
MVNRIETPNLTLVYAQFSDSNDLLRGIRESLKELSTTMPWAVHEYNVRDAQAYLQQAVTGNQEGREFTYIIRTKMGSFVGAICLSPKLDPMGRVVPAYEIGYWIRTPDTGHGYASEALQGLANHAISVLKANRVQIECDSGQASSVRVAEKAGFVLEARLKNTRRYADDTLGDTLIYSKTP